MLETNAGDAQRAFLKLWFVGGKHPYLKATQFCLEGLKPLPQAGLNAKQGPTFRWVKGVKSVCLLMLSYARDQSAGDESNYMIAEGHNSPAMTIYGVWDKDPQPWTQDIFGLDPTKQHSNFYRLLTAQKERLDELDVRYRVTLQRNLLPPKAIQFYLDGELMDQPEKLARLAGDLHRVCAGDFTNLPAPSATPPPLKEAPASRPLQLQPEPVSQPQPESHLANFCSTISDPSIKSLKSFLIAALNQPNGAQANSPCPLLAPECVVAIASKLAHSTGGGWKEFYDNSTVPLPPELVRSVSMSIAADEGMRRAFSESVTNDGASGLRQWFEIAASHFPQPFVERMAGYFYEEEKQLLGFLAEPEAEGTLRKSSPWLDIRLLVQHGCISSAKKLLRLYGANAHELFRDDLENFVPRVVLRGFVEECAPIFEPEQHQLFSEILSNALNKHADEDARRLRSGGV